MKKIKTITINKPIKSGLPVVIKEMFEQSNAISEAVSQFWGLGLANKAELAGVRETPGFYEVDISY